MKDRSFRTNKKIINDKTGGLGAAVERIRKARALGASSDDAGMDRYFDWMVHCGKAYFFIGKVS
jgi:hypothetical protein